jgi:hypothetical protein
MTEQRDMPVGFVLRVYQRKTVGLQPDCAFAARENPLYRRFSVVHAEERCRLFPPRLWTQSGLEAPDLQPGCFKADLILSFNGDPSGSNCSAAFSCSEAFSACPVAI